MADSFEAKIGVFGGRRAAAAGDFLQCGEIYTKYTVTEIVINNANLMAQILSNQEI